MYVRNSEQVKEETTSETYGQVPPLTEVSVSITLDN